jgi:hypothetical protein
MMIQEKEAFDESIDWLLAHHGNRFAINVITHFLSPYCALYIAISGMLTYQN